MTRYSSYLRNLLFFGYKFFIYIILSRQSGSKCTIHWLVYQALILCLIFIIFLIILYDYIIFVLYYLIHILFIQNLRIC